MELGLRIGRSLEVESIAAFLRDTSVEDRYWRFGDVSHASVDWLVERMQTDRSRGAYVALSGRQVIGLLDFVTLNEETEFGILVRSSRRRQGIGTSLVRSFIDGVGRSRPGARIVAYCDLGNRPALRLMRTSGLQPAPIDCDWTRFELIAGAACGDCR